MTTKVFIKAADLKRMALVAKSEGVIVEAEIDGVIFRVRPDVATGHQKRDPLDFQTIAEWQKWKDTESAIEAG